MSSPSQDSALLALPDGMNVYWLEQTEADLPPDNAWLSLEEARQMDRLRFAKRRADWRLGRWTAKRAVALCLGIPEQPRELAEIEILAAPSGAPEVVLDVQLATNFAIPLVAPRISLSHSCDRAVCAVALSGAALGCDLEEIAPRSDAFVADFFTAQEQATVARSSPADRPRISTLIWSAKESSLKALHTGLRLDTRSLIVTAGESFCEWQTLRVHHRDGQIFLGWWQEAEGFVRTIVSNHVRPNLPIYLREIAASTIHRTTDRSLALNAPRR